MRILYIVPSLIQAGPVNVALDLVSVMQEHGHECEVAYFDEVTDVPLNKFSCRTMRIGLSERLDLGKYDVVHTHGFRPDLYVRLHGRKWRKRVRFVATMHNFVFREQRILHGPIRAALQGVLVLFAAASHQRIITLLESAQKYYSRWLPERKLRVCHNTRILEQKEPEATDVERIEAMRQNVKYIMVACSVVNRRKNLQQVVEALPMMPGVGFMVIGDGPEREMLSHMAQRLGVEDRVLLLGRRAAAYRYIPLFDLFVIPSRSEGFPLGLLEAAALGKASVSSDIGVFEETFDSEELPRFRLDDPEDLARVVMDALTRREELGRRIRKRFERDYSPERFYQQHMKVYTDLEL